MNFRHITVVLDITNLYFGVHVLEPGTKHHTFTRVSAIVNSFRSDFTFIHTSFPSIVTKSKIYLKLKTFYNYKPTSTLMVSNIAHQSTFFELECINKQCQRVTVDGCDAV